MPNHQLGSDGGLPCRAHLSFSPLQRASLPRFGLALYSWRFVGVGLSFVGHRRQWLVSALASRLVPSSRLPVVRDTMGLSAPGASFGSLVLRPSFLHAIRCWAYASDLRVSSALVVRFDHCRCPVSSKLTRLPPPSRHHRPLARRASASPPPSQCILAGARRLPANLLLLLRAWLGRPRSRRKRGNQKE